MTPIIVATVLASIVASILAIAGEPIPFLGPARVPAATFPKPDRPVASIVSPIWHDEKSRDAADEVGQVVRLIGIKPGMTVADIGAGSGYYTVRLSPIVGRNGRVIAEDVTADYLQGLQQRVRELGLENIVIGLGEPHDPRLPTGSIDMAILVHMYHEVAQPYALLYNLVPALKPGARVGIVDASAETSEHGTPPPLLRCELAAVGYHEIGFHPLSGSNTYLAIFAPPSSNDRPA
ncbi:MAG: methyltransferase domain-containing protein, partial [Bradyrhizobiaceae bacterium]|nr:methyltransferase domain-containing protein [Bradyrhizobiaceae bacterium]